MYQLVHSANILLSPLVERRGRLEVTRLQTYPLRLQQSFTSVETTMFKQNDSMDYESRPSLRMVAKGLQQLHKGTYRSTTHATYLNHMA